MDKTSSADARNYTTTLFVKGPRTESKGKSITEESRFRNARLTLRFVKSSSNRYPLCSTMPQNEKELFVWSTAEFTWSRIQIDVRSIHEYFPSVWCKVQIRIYTDTLIHSHTYIYVHGEHSTSSLAFYPSFNSEGIIQLKKIETLTYRNHTL